MIIQASTSLIHGPELHEPVIRHSPRERWNFWRNYRDYMGVIHYRDYIGMMENQMETAIVCPPIIRHSTRERWSPRSRLVKLLLYGEGKQVL